MTFISPLFILFISIVIFVNYILPPRFRYLVILIAGLVFVGFYNIESLIAVLLFTLFNFYLAKLILNNKALFIFGIAVNVLAIILFNYFNTTTNGLHFSFTLISFQIDKFIVALGLSFYSLQNIAYLTEVYSKRMTAETNLTKYMLYSVFFPKFISGPVMLPVDFISQIDNLSLIHI